MGQAKRLLISLVILLSFAAIGFVPTLASADDGARFTLPARQEGDRFEYELTDDAPFGVGNDFAVEQPMEWKDERGVWHRADVLTSVVARFQFGEFSFESKFSSLVDGDTWEPLAASTSAAGGSSSNGNLIPLLETGSQSSTHQEWQFTPGSTFHPCGALNGLQGATEWQASIRVGGDCDDGGPATFTYDRTTQWKGAPAMVYTHDGAPAWFGATKGVELTFAAGIPYPVEVRMLGSDERVAQLSGFFRGSGPVLFPESLPLDTPLPSVGTSIATRYGPDLGAVDAAYPIEAAIATARDDPSYADARDFMAANPDWRVSYADYEQDGDTSTWLIRLSTPDNGFAFHAVRSPNEPAGLDLSATGLHWSTRHRTLDILGNPAPALADMPIQVPSAEDITRAWQRYSGTDDAPTAGGFSFGFCASIGCSDHVTVTVGAVPQSPPNQGGSPGGLQDEPQAWEGEAHKLRYGLEGLASIGHVTSSYTNSGGILAEPAPASEGDNTESGIVLAAPAATVGLMAGLLAALVVYFWPALKTVPSLALFSRLQAPQLLDHPSRQRIVDAVTAEPGIHFKELQRKTKLANGTLRHHTRHLSTAGIISERPQGGFTCFYAGTHVEAGLLAAAPVLKSEGARKILDAVKSKPGITSQELQGRTGLAHGTIGYHLKRLREAGLVDARRDRRAVHLYPSAA